MAPTSSATLVMSIASDTTMRAVSSTQASLFWLFDNSCEMVPQEFVEVNLQPEVGEEAYRKGAKMLDDFFRSELQKYLTPELDPLGREIIEAFMRGASIEEYEKLL